MAVPHDDRPGDQHDVGEPGDPTVPGILRPPLPRTVAFLLESRIPARLAWTARRGGPRVAPIWFHWSGTRLEVVSFAGAEKLRDIGDGDEVAVSIDTDEFPYRSLKLRGIAHVRATSGLATSYRAAATRYLGATTAERWLRFLGDVDQAVISIAPAWATLSDMSTDSPFFTELAGGRS